MSPRKSSQELTKEMIVKEADEQFKQKGFQHVSMRGIAKQLGCSHGALYYHLRTKQSFLMKWLLSILSN
ncbi:TetR/AcrR family transcriptional regulator [Bacillus sp. JCM 19041]|uniref:TetR/AcrR family transcriptional regulator n=1 Tax=Bacillus sp. JCM 19041 TaxID=1460637 RepID=UPI0006D2834D